MASPPSATMVEKNEAALPAARPYSSLPSPLDSETPDVASLFPTAMTGKRPSPYGQDSQVSNRLLLKQFPSCRITSAADA